MARGAQDILNQQRWEMPDTQLSFITDTFGGKLTPTLEPDEQRVVDLLQNEALSFDELLSLTNFTPEKLNMLLTTMEIKEIMKQLPGCMYALDR